MLISVHSWLSVEAGDRRSQNDFLSLPAVNGADRISDIEGKIARVSGERVGRRPSFKSVVAIPFPKIRVYSCTFVVNTCFNKQRAQAAWCASRIRHSGNPARAKAHPPPHSSGG